MFSRSQYPPSNHAINIDSANVLISSTTKYLGLVIDSKLSMRAQIEKKCLAATRIALGLRKFSSLKGIDKKKPKLLYKVSFITTLLYGCYVWAQSLRSRWCKRPFRKAQSHFTRLKARGFKNVTYQTLLAITKNLLIDLLALQVCVCRFLALRHIAFLPLSLLSKNRLLGQKS